LRIEDSTATVSFYILCRRCDHIPATHRSRLRKRADLFSIDRRWVADVYADAASHCNRDPIVSRGLSSLRPNTADFQGRISAVPTLVGMSCSGCGRIGCVWAYPGGCRRRLPNCFGVDASGKTHHRQRNQGVAHKFLLNLYSIAKTQRNGGGFVGREHRQVRGRSNLVLE
jgi:hypothetical protein